MADRRSARGRAPAPYLDRRFDDLAHGVSVTDAAIDGAGRARSGPRYSHAVRELEGRSSPTDSTARPPRRPATRTAPRANRSAGARRCRRSANGFAVLGLIVLVVLVVPLEQTAEHRSARRLPLFGRTSSLLFGALLGRPFLRLRGSRLLHGRGDSAGVHVALQQPSPRAFRSSARCSANLFPLRLRGAWLLRRADDLVAFCVALRRPRLLPRFSFSARCLAALPSFRLHGAWLLRGRRSRRVLAFVLLSGLWPPRFSFSARCFSDRLLLARRRRVWPVTPPARRRCASGPWMSSRST